MNPVCAVEMRYFLRVKVKLISNFGTMIRDLILLPLLLCLSQTHAQHIYYKTPDAEIVRNFSDSANRVLIRDTAGNELLKNQMAWVLRFFPDLQVKNIEVVFKPSGRIAHTKPFFSDLLKAPSQRIYRITFSNSTHSTADSAVLANLSFNAQLGLIAREMSQVEELSRSGFLDHVIWYFRQLSRRGRNRIFREAETRTLEIGLGYQLLALNTETARKLQIDHWQNAKGYASYVKYTQTPAMKPQQISDLLSDLPVYVKQTYK